MGFDHVAFQVSDMDISIQFYTGKLNFSLNFRATNEQEHEEYALLAQGDARIELIQDLANPYRKPDLHKPYCPHFCIEIEDMKVGVELLKQQSIPILRGPLEIPGEETWVYFADPDHNVLEFIQWFRKK